jgi:hypothetical protein
MKIKSLNSLLKIKYNLILFIKVKKYLKEKNFFSGLEKKKFFFFFDRLFSFYKILNLILFHYKVKENSF